MVSWWKTKECVEASIRTAKDGSYQMFLEGEKYPLTGYPRGYLLYGKLSPLKHKIKNWIFNDAWKMLEDGLDRQEIIHKLKTDVLDKILQEGYELRYEQPPFERLVPAVKEIHTAWTKVIKGHPNEKKLAQLRDILCLILHEDDSYRFRVQWLVKFFPRFRKVKSFEIALKMMEHAEVVDDMKERIRLLRTILLLLLEDQGIRKMFEEFVKEVNWGRVKLTKAEQYHFRGKYFKVDYDRYDY